MRNHGTFWSIVCFTVIFSASLCCSIVAQAQEHLTLAAGQRGNWDTSVAEIGNRAGIFAEHGLELEIIYTQGGGETMQTVISGAVDIGIGPSVMGVLSAYARGAPVRVLGAQMTGSQDLYWYVRSDSPLHSLEDIDGQTIAYSTTGASTHVLVKAFIDQYGLDARPVPTGSPPATLTQVMAGLVDVGWAAPPFGLEQLEKNDIRIIGRGSDAIRFAGKTMRLLIVNARTLAAERGKFEKFMSAYRESLDRMYSDPALITLFAEYADVTEAMARRTRDEFFPKASLDPDQVLGLEASMPAAIELGYLNRPLDPDQLEEWIQIPPRE